MDASQPLQVQENLNYTDSSVSLQSLESTHTSVSQSQTLSDFKSSPAHETFKPKINNNLSLHKYIDIVSNMKIKKNLSSHLLFVFGNCLPLNITENRSTIDHYKNIRPGFILHSCHKLSNKLLNIHYENFFQDVKENINNSYSLGLTCDGWTNVKGDSIINIIITTPKPIFYTSVDTKSKQYIGIYMKDIIINVFKKIGEFKFSTVVTYNATNMKVALNLIQNDYPHISCYGCVAHGLNLLVEDITTKLLLLN